MDPILVEERKTGLDQKKSDEGELGKNGMDLGRGWKKSARQTAFERAGCSSTRHELQPLSIAILETI